jgi:hypothetical protein
MPVDEVVYDREPDRRRACTAAHSVGIVHRDLKPDNVMYDPESRLGEACSTSASLRTPILPPEERLTRAGLLRGNADVRSAPEALSGELVGPLADQYSLATIAYFPAHWRAAVSRLKTPREMFSQLLSQPPIPLNQANAGSSLPGSDRSVVMRGSEQGSDAAIFGRARVRCRVSNAAAIPGEEEKRGLFFEAFGALSKELIADRDLCRLVSYRRFRRPSWSRRRRRHVAGMNRQPHREARPFAELALDAMSPPSSRARRLRSQARDRCRAASSRPRTGVHLLEFVEDALLIGGRDADSGVDDLQGDPRADACPARATASTGSSGVVRRASTSGGSSGFGRLLTKRARTAIPPLGVYLMALPIRFTRM